MASLSYRYETSQVWLVDLVLEADPSWWDMCPHHADSLTVPRGWERVDQRTRPPAPIEPAGRDLVPPAPQDAALARSGAGRYAQLSRDLPRLAAEFGSGADVGQTGPDDAGDDQQDGPVGQAPVEDAVDQAPAQEASPHADSPGPSSPQDHTEDPPPPHREIDGQLSLTTADDDARGAVVVSINSANARRSRPRP